MRSPVFSALCLGLALPIIAVAAGPAPGRPDTWARPVAGTTLKNCFRVSDELYRSAQPRARDLPALGALAVKTVLDLRRYHADSVQFQRAGFHLEAEGMGAGNVTVPQLIAALRKFRAAPKPVLVHCWHGSDRTGFFVAGYRIVFQGWSRDAAIAELKQGGFGFNAARYPNIVRVLAGLDADSVRRQVLSADAGGKP